MKCSKCGAEVPETDAFCPKCGQALSANAPTDQPAPQPQAAPPQGAPSGYVQQPVYVQPMYVQQPVYVQPAPQQPKTASPAEKEAFFSTAGSIWMLIAAIVFTLNLVSALVSSILSLNIGGIVTFVLLVIMDVGFWILFASGKKKKLGTKGVSLIKVPYIINFVFTVLSFAGNLIVWFFTLNVISLVVGIITFVFQCICFASVKKTLDMAGTINSDRTVAGLKAGIFAAVVMIISASFTLASDIVSYFVTAALVEALKSTPLAFLATLLGGGNVMVLVTAAVSFLAGISVAIVLLQFAKRIKQANS